MQFHNPERGSALGNFGSTESPARIPKPEMVAIKIMDKNKILTSQHDGI